MFVLLLVVWVLLVWPFDPVTGCVSVQDLVAGVVVALLAALIMRDDSSGGWFLRILHPVKLWWLVVYVFVLAYYVVKANFDVAYRILHPDMPINPGIVKVKTNLKSAPGITLLANSITLTPGTLTVHAMEDGRMYIHWINVKTTDVGEATEKIVGHFEWLIKKIFD